MLKKPVLNGATKNIKSRLSNKVAKDKKTEKSESEPNAERASCKCPSCDQQTTITETYTLAPNETHTEPCSVCGEEISMEYDSHGNWTVDITTQSSSDDLSTLKAIE